MHSVLFITWDGPQVRYLETLFLPIFARLRARGYAFHVLQFTWGNAERIEETARACEALGIPYRSRRIWRGAGGLGPFVSAVLGAREIARAARRWQIDILMPRSLMPALAMLAMRGKRGFRTVFDADGLAADERVDFAGLSPRGTTYRVLRHVEARMTRSADRVLTRTADAVAILSARAGKATGSGKFHVVSNGVDPERFSRANRAAALPNESAPFRLGFCGSFGEQYCPEDMFRIAERLRAEFSGLRFSIFTRDRGRVREWLDDSGRHGLDWLELCSLSPEEVPCALQTCDLALALREPAFSTRAVSPIKVGEYLLAGVPVICTSGVGGVQDLPANEVIYTGPVDDTAALLEWLERLRAKGKQHVRNECQALGRAYFGIDATVDQYAAALEGL